MSARTGAQRARMHRNRQRFPMPRPHGRVTRSSDRQKLKEKIARQISATRRLPGDFPVVRRNDALTDEFMPVAEGVFRRCERWLDRSRLAVEIEQRLHAHPAPPSRLPVKAALMGMVLTLHVTGGYERTDVCKILCGLTARQAHRIGLCHPDTGYVRFSYEMAQTQVKRIEDALHDGWHVPADEGDDKRIERNLAWFAETAISHSIPEAHKDRIAAVALDSTAVPTWARAQVHGKEDDLQEQLRLNPPPPTPPGQPPAVGDIGPHGRVRRTNCPDALPAYTADRIVSGFDGHMVTAIRDANWHGDPDNIDIGAEVIPYILSVVVMPGQVEYAQSGVQALQTARLNAPNADEVIVDMGYSQIPDFLRGVRRLGYEPIFDYKSEPGGTDKPNQKVHMVRIGTAGGGEAVLMNDGVLMPIWTPAEWQKPPIELKGDALAEWRANRYRLFAYVCIGTNADGSYRVKCPQCAGKIRTTARTRSTANKAASKPAKPRTKRTPGPKPRQLPRIKIDDSHEFCCGGVRTIRPETAAGQLVQYQHIPHGTPAWKQRYGYRNPSEGTNSRLKNQGTLRPGWCKALGIAATTVGAVLGAVVFNLREAERYRQEQKQQGTPPPDTPEARFEAAVDRSPTAASNSSDTAPNVSLSGDTPATAVSNGQHGEPDTAADTGNHDRAPP